MIRGTTVFDRHGLLQVFASMAGRRFVGVEDGGDCVELVFDNPENTGGNLVTVYPDGVNKGSVLHGFVSQDFIEEGYGHGDAELPRIRSSPRRTSNEQSSSSLAS